MNRVFIFKTFPRVSYCNQVLWCRSGLSRAFRYFFIHIWTISLSFLRIFDQISWVSAPLKIPVIFKRNKNGIKFSEDIRLFAKKLCVKLTSFLLHLNSSNGSLIYYRRIELLRRRWGRMIWDMEQTGYLKSKVNSKKTQKKLITTGCEIS